MTPNQMPASALKKITAKDVIKGKPEKESVTVNVTNDDGSPVLDDAGKVVTRTVSRVKPQESYVIVGEAHAYETGSTQFGDYVTYEGVFEAQRILDGKRFQSTRCIFPPIADAIALDTFMRAKKDDPMAVVQFAFVIGLDPDDRAATGYKFTCTPLNPGEEKADPLEALKSSLQGKLAMMLGDAGKALGLSSPDDMKTIEGETKVLDKPAAKGKADA